MRQLQPDSSWPESRAAGEPRTTDPAGGSHSLSEMSGMFSDSGNEQLVPGLVPGVSLPIPAPSRRNRATEFPVGILLYLASVGLVTIASIGVFLGTGFFLLAQPTKELITSYETRHRDTETNSMRSEMFPRPYRDAPPTDHEVAPEETEMPRSTAAGALPVSPVAEGPAVGEAVLRQESYSAPSSVPVSPDDEPVSSAAKGETPGAEVLRRRSTSDEATIIAPAQTASEPEPVPSFPATPAPLPAPASVRVFTAQIAEFLAQRATAWDEVITFQQYRDFRIHDLTQRRARLAQQLAAPNLSQAEEKRLERQKTYYDRLAAMPAEEGDRHFRERFDEIDANHDGKLDPEERAVWREKQREYYQQQATERAVSRLSDSSQTVRPPQAGQTNPFAQRLRNK